MSEEAVRLLVSRLVRDHFLPAPKIPSGEYVGEFLIGGKWYVSRWGCDTVQKLLDDLQEELRRERK